VKKVVKMGEGKSAAPYKLVLPDEDLHEENGFNDLKVGSLYCPTDLMKCFSEYVSEVFPKIGWEESFYWANWRLLLCAAGCGFACWGHFMTKFPDGRVMLGLCVCSYFILSGFVAVLDYFILQASVVAIFPPQDSGLPQERIFLDVSMDRFESEITLIVRSTDGKTCIEKKNCASKYFTEDGYFECQACFADFALMLVEYYGKDKLTFVGETKKGK